MSELTGEAKRLLRLELRARLATLPAQVRERGSGEICGRVKEVGYWRQAQYVLGYAPKDDEPDIWPLLLESRAAGKRVVLPRYDASAGRYSVFEVDNLATDLVVGRFGIREPVGNCPPAVLNRLDFSLVPGVGFDLTGRRLGRGGGFYDRLLAEIGGVTCGVAFDEQLVRQVPAEAHDVVLNCILTPTRWLDCSRGAALE